MRNKIWYSALFYLLFSLLSINCFAAAFEDIGIGARGRGVGGAFTAVVDDASAIYWNPSALAKFKKDEMTVFYQDLYGLGLVNYNFVGFVHPKVGRGSVGFGWIRLGTSGRVNFMDYSENTFIFSYGVKLSQSFLIGVNAKYYWVDYDVKASGFGMDLATSYDMFNSKLRLSAVGYNINTPEIIWETAARDNLQPIIRIGARYAVDKNHFFSIESNQQIGKTNHLSYGWESWFFKRGFGVRAGFAELDSHINPAFGFSVGYGIARFDYTLERHYSLGYSSLFNLSLAF